jgi:hypothetical protein
MAIAAVAASKVVTRALRPTIFDFDVLALDKACVFQALAESTQPFRVSIGRRGVEEPDHWHRRLLRACREWPRRCRAAEQGDEVAPSRLRTR